MVEATEARMVCAMADSGFADYLPRSWTAHHHSSGQVLWRAAASRDINGIIDVDAQAGRLAAKAESLAAAIADENRLVTVATVYGDIVGWAKTHFWDHQDGPAPAGHYLGGITVRPDWRRRGVAVILTRARMDWIWERADCAWYVVNASNFSSIELHRRWQFSEVARAARLHTTEFSGGVGLLMRATRPQGQGLH